jgi:hypothetical protein
MLFCYSRLHDQGGVQQVTVADQNQGRVSEWPTGPVVNRERVIIALC